MSVWTSVNSLWPNDGISRYRNGLSLAQVMVCWLTINNLNHCWITLSEDVQHWYKNTFTWSAQTTPLYNELENYTFKAIAHSPTGQRFKMHNTLVRSLSNPQNRLDICTQYWCWNPSSRTILTRLPHTTNNMAADVNKSQIARFMGPTWAHPRWAPS